MIYYSIVNYNDPFKVFYESQLQFKQKEWTYKTENKPTPLG